MSNREARTVWIEEERVFGELMGPEGAFFSPVRYTKGGIEYEVLLERDEYTLLEDLIEYDSE